MTREVGLDQLCNKGEGHDSAKQIEEAMSSRYSISTNRMEYDAEVAYVVATSPPQTAGGDNEDEFDFSFPESQLRDGLKILKATANEPQGGGILGREGRREEGEETDLGKEGDGEATVAREREGGVEEREMKRVGTPEEREWPDATEDRNSRKSEGKGTGGVEATEDVLQTMVVIFGATNYANRQLVNKLVQSNPSIFTLVVPHTSRVRRPNEIHGLDFHFVDRKEMSSQIRGGSFVECVKISSPKAKPRAVRAYSASSTLPAHTISPLSAPGQRSATMASRPTPSNLEMSSPGSSTSASPTSPAAASLTGQTAASLPSQAAVIPPSQGSESPLTHRPSTPIVQMPSPLLTPKTRHRVRSNTNSSELFGTSKEAIHRARLQGKPCIVLNVTYKGAEQLQKAGYEGLYIMVDQGEKGAVDEADVGTSNGDQLKPDYVITGKSKEQAFSELQRHAFQAVSSLPLSPRSKFDVTRDVWETIPTVQMDQQTESSPPFPQQRLLTFSDLLVHFQSAKAGRKPEKEKKVSGLSKHLRTEWKLVISLSQIQLSEQDSIHLVALQTLYQKLMGNSLRCLRYGPHWQDIGFQGVDPAEDIKEVGVLGIMQLIYFLDSSRNNPLIKEIFSYSREGTYQFPFMVLSINMTQVALSCLREGHLTKFCNKQDQVFITLNEFYIALFYRFFELWKSQGHSSPQIGPILRDIESYAKRHPKNVIADVQAYLESGKDDHEKFRKISRSLSNPFTPFNQLAEELPAAATPSANPS